MNFTTTTYERGQIVDEAEFPTLTAARAYLIDQLHFVIASDPAEETDDWLEAIKEIAVIPPFTSGEAQVSASDMRWVIQAAQMPNLTYAASIDNVWDKTAFTEDFFTEFPAARDYVGTYTDGPSALFAVEQLKLMLGSDEIVALHVLMED